MAKSLNRVQLIGNLTRDPELRYTPSGTAVCTFSIATNRSWKMENGERRDETEFHRVVAWGKLAEICSQFLTKGRKVYVEGRLTTRTWQGQDGSQRSTTEVIILDMILLDSRRQEEVAVEPEEPQESSAEASETAAAAPKKSSPKTSADAKALADKQAKPVQQVQGKQAETEESADEEVAPDDIPF